MSLQQARDFWRTSQRTFEEAGKIRDAAWDRYKAEQQREPSLEPERACLHQTNDTGDTATSDNGVAKTPLCQPEIDSKFTANGAYDVYLEAQSVVDYTQSCRSSARKAFEDMLFGSQNSQPGLENLLPKLLMKILAFSLELSLINVHPKIRRALPSFSRCSTALHLHAFYHPGRCFDLSIQPQKQLGSIYDNVLRPFLKQPVSYEFVREHSAANLGIGQYPLSDESNMALQHTILLSRWWSTRHFSNFRLQCAQSMMERLTRLAEQSNIDIWNTNPDGTRPETDPTSKPGFEKKVMYSCWPLGYVKIDPNEDRTPRKFLSSAIYVGNYPPATCCRRARFTVVAEALYAWLGMPWNLSSEQTTLYEIDLPVELFSRPDLDSQGHIVGLVSRAKCCLEHYQSRIKVHSMFATLDEIERTIDQLAPYSAVAREDWKWALGHLWEARQWRLDELNNEDEEE